MRSCTVCGKASPDLTPVCPQCGSDLDLTSTTAVARRRLIENPRVSRVRLMAAHDACPACQAASAEFPKEHLPDLPAAGCSHALGCRCFYEPALLTIYP